MTPGGADMWEPQFTADELKLVVDEARQLRLPVAAHAHGTSSIRAAVDAGVDTIEHCTWLSGPGVFAPDERIARAIVAAEIAANNNDWRPIARHLGAERVQQIVGRVPWLGEQGVHLITGTNAGMGPFGNFAAALQRFALWDFTPEQIIEMATTGTADALGLADTTGQLTAGLDADLLVLTGDPLSDLAALGQLELVVAAGQLHRPAPVLPDL